MDSHTGGQTMVLLFYTILISVDLDNWEIYIMLKLTFSGKDGLNIDITCLGLMECQ